MENNFDFAGQFNKGHLFDFQIPDDFGYLSLQELYETHCDEGSETVFPLLAVYINKKSKFGFAPVFVTNIGLVNIPKHMLDTAEKILDNSEAIEAINANKVGFTIYTYVDKKHGKDCYGVKFVNM